MNNKNSLRLLSGLVAIFANNAINAAAAVDAKASTTVATSPATAKPAATNTAAAAPAKPAASTVSTAVIAKPTDASVVKASASTSAQSLISGFILDVKAATSWTIMVSKSDASAPALPTGANNVARIVITDRDDNATTYYVGLGGGVFKQDANGLTDLKIQYVPWLQGLSTQKDAAYNNVLCFLDSKVLLAS